MKPIIFRPEGKKFSISHGRKSQDLTKENHYSSVRVRGKPRRDFWPAAQQATITAYHQCHWWSGHGPYKAGQRWKQAHLRWNKKMNRNAPVHYINKYSIHKFL